MKVFLLAHRDVVKQPEGGAATARRGGDVVRVAANGAALPLTGTVWAGRHHQALLVPHVDRTFHSVPVKTAAHLESQLLCGNRFTVTVTII